MQMFSLRNNFAPTAKCNIELPSNSLEMCTGILFYLPVGF